MCNASLSGARLANSDILQKLGTHLRHLSLTERSDVERLVYDYPSLYSDVSTKTTVLCHGIDVEGHGPIRQNAYRVSPAKILVM